MIQGALTALVTPYDGKWINWGLIQALVEYNAGRGIDGIVPAGCTGQSFTLCDDDQVSIIKVVANAAAEYENLMVIAGDGSNDTAKAVNLAQRVEKETGAHFHMQIAPYANKPDPEGAYLHFMSVLDASVLPVILYNVPSRVGKGIDLTSDKYLDMTVQLARHPRVEAFKAASGKIDQIEKLIKATEGQISVLSGDDGLTLEIIKRGGKGVISVASNVVPGMVSDMVHYALEGQLDKAKEIDKRLRPLYKALFIQNNPQCVHYALRRMGCDVGVPKPPLHSLDEDDQRKYDLPMFKDARTKSRRIIDEALIELKLI